LIRKGWDSQPTLPEKEKDEYALDMTFGAIPRGKSEFEGRVQFGLRARPDEREILRFA